MSEPRLPASLSTAEANDAAAWFSRTYSGWTWPELLRALESVVPAEIARDVLPTLLTRFPDEPRHPAEVLRQMLRPWTSPPASPPLSVVTPEPVDPGTIADALPALYSVAELARWLDLSVGELEWFADHGGWL